MCRPERRTRCIAQPQPAPQQPQPARQHAELQLQQRAARAACTVAVHCVATLRKCADTCGVAIADAKLASLQQQAGVPLKHGVGGSITYVPDIMCENAVNVAAAAVAAVKQAQELASRMEARVAAREYRNAGVNVQHWLLLMYGMASALCEMEMRGWSHGDVTLDSLYVTCEHGDASAERKWCGRLGDFGLSMLAEQTNNEPLDVRSTGLTRTREGAAGHGRREARAGRLGAWRVWRGAVEWRRDDARHGGAVRTA